MQTTSLAAVPLPRAQPRQTIAVLVLLWLLTGAAYGCVYPFISVYAARRGLSLTDIGILSAVGGGTAALLQPIIGRLVDRFGRRRTLMALATAGGAAGFIALGLVTQTPWIIATFALGALGFYGTRVVIIASTVTVVESGGHGAAMFARYRAVPAFGFTLTAVAGGLLLARVPFALLFTLGAALYLLAGLCGLSLPTPAGPRERDAAPAEQASANAALARRVVFSLAAMSLLYNAASSSADTYVPLLMRQLHGSFTAVGLTGTVSAIVEIPLMILFGSLADRMSRALLLAIGMCVVPLRFALFVVVQTPPQLLGAQMLDAISFSVFAIVGVSLLAEQTPREERAFALAVYSAAGTVGPIAGPLLSGLLATRMGLQPMFGVLAIVGAVVPLSITLGLWPLLRATPGAAKA